MNETTKTSGMYIILREIKMYAYHGVLEQERRVGAEYTVNLRLSTDFARAAVTDSLDDTVNYAEVFDETKAEMQQPSRLLEHVAYRIARRLLNRFPVLNSVHVEIYKQNPPMGAECGQTGVEATFTR